jgi:hypothetical protein
MVSNPTLPRFPSRPNACGASVPPAHPLGEREREGGREGEREHTYTNGRVAILTSLPDQRAPLADALNAAQVLCR